MVHLASRTEHAGDGRDKKPRTNRPDILAFLHAEKGGQPCVEPWRSIPIQRVQVVANRVEGMLACGCLNAATHHPRWRGNLVLLEPFARADIVVVRPPLYRPIAPWRRLPRDRPRRELVVSEHTVPFGRIAKRVEDVTEVTQRHAVLVQHQAVGPVISSGLEGHHRAAHRETPIESCRPDYDDPGCNFGLIDAAVMLWRR